MVYLGNTAQSAFGISWKICALISSLFLEVHKVHLRKSAFIRTQIFSGSALAELCGIAFIHFAPRGKRLHDDKTDINYMLSAITVENGRRVHRCIEYE